MRKALVVGINHYPHISPLFGCVNDAYGVKAMLDRHADGSVNFDVKTLLGTGPADIVERHRLRDAIEDLFSGRGDVALLYFAGHGHIEATGGYLCAGDCKTGNDGIALSEVMILANKSSIQNRVVVLDSCHSGVVGGNPNIPELAELKEGVTILTASTAEQYASEENGSGVFTNLFIDALGGAAANLVGDVTPGSIYAHVDQSLGAWGQRPVFKTNVERFISLRKVQPALELAELRRISGFFPEPGGHYQLDPTYEPERHSGWEENPQGIPAPDPDHTAIFAILQKYNRVGLLVPEGAPHMWHAAMESKSVRLTALGEHYRRLASKSLI
jgi:hypothetical protein